MASSIEYSSLVGGSTLTELGRGGEGVVYRAPGHPDKVYKEFLAAAYTTPDISALSRLIDLQAAWSPEERAWLRERTVWPETMILRNGKLMGFLMPSIHQRFIRKHGIRSNPKTVFCEWNYLSLRNKFQANPNISTEVPRVSHLDALKLVYDLAQTIAALHRHGVIVGDISGKNLLWTDKPSFHVLIIDCDSFRIGTQSGVASPKQSPDWDDPHLNGQPTSQDSDVYKLALAAFRAIWSSGTDRPSPGGTQLSRPDGIPEEIVQLIAASMQPVGRPSAEDWVRTLAIPARLGGRPAIKVGTPGVSRPSQPTGGSIPRGPRPTLQMGKDQPG